MTKKISLSIIFVTVVCLSGCGSQNNSAEEIVIPTPNPKVSDTFSGIRTLFEFSVCQVHDSVESMESTIKKIEDGYLAKKDLDEVMLEVVFSLEMLNKELGDTQKPVGTIGDSSIAKEYQERELFEINQAISNGWDKEFIDFYDYYAKKRVILLESNKLDLNDLRQKNIEVDELLSTYCSKID
jgi:hypothetical protein